MTNEMKLFLVDLAAVLKWHGATISANEDRGQWHSEADGILVDVGNGKRTAHSATTRK